GCLLIVITEGFLRKLENKFLWSASCLWRCIQKNLNLRFYVNFPHHKWHKEKVSSGKQWEDDLRGFHTKKQTNSVTSTRSSSIVSSLKTKFIRAYYLQLQDLFWVESEMRQGR